MELGGIDPMPGSDGCQMMGCQVMGCQAGASGGLQGLVVVLADG